jgi:dTDP-4-amino-4,6-dideoxygalactose transaminase
MAAMLANIQSGDEVIIPSYTFVSTALAFVRQGAKIIFADSNAQNPNIDVQHIQELITPKTKVIVPVHYAGIACDMDPITELAKRYDLLIIEDAAQAIDSFYKGIPLGSIGDMAAFSFHETKNINSGEGGMLAINNERLMNRAEIIWEKGTNRSEFFRGEVDKYGWVDIGSSFLPSEIIAAYLYAQIENLDNIQLKRKQIWKSYFEGLKSLQNYGIQIPFIPDYATNNAHMFYLVCSDLRQRSLLIEHLKNNNIHSVFHYQSLHKSPYYISKHDKREIPFSDKYTDCLVRLPLYYELASTDLQRIIDTILEFFARYE